MAANLVKAGFDLAVCDVMPGRSAKFEEEVGGRAASSPADAAGGADAVITILPTSKQVQEVAATITGVLARDALLIDMSSGVPGRTREIAEALASPRRRPGVRAEIGAL